MKPSERIYEIMNDEIQAYQKKYRTDIVNTPQFLAPAILKYLDEQQNS